MKVEPIQHRRYAPWALALGTVHPDARTQAPTCLRPTLARLAVLVGDWKVDWSYRLQGQLVAVENATATIRSRADRCALMMNMEGKAGLGHCSRISARLGRPRASFTETRSRAPDGARPGSAPRPPAHD